MTARPNSSRRGPQRAVDTSSIEATADAQARLRALNVQIQKLNPGHDEVRRLLPMFLDTVVEILAPEKKDDKDEQ